MLAVWATQACAGSAKMQLVQDMCQCSGPLHRGSSSVEMQLLDYMCPVLCSALEHATSAQMHLVQNTCSCLCRGLPPVQVAQEWTACFWSVLGQTKRDPAALGQNTCQCRGHDRKVNNS